MTNSFSQYRHVRGHARRGRRRPGEGLPVHNFYTDEGDVAMKCPTEVPITDRREKELADLGFVPLVHCKDTDYAAFFSVQSAQKPKLYDTDSANANARLSTQIPYIMAVSRFAHYLKAMMRDKIGSFMSRTEAEIFLNRWITKYVVPDDTASPSDEGAVSAARGAHRRGGGYRKARCVQGSCFPTAAFPVGGVDRFVAAGCGPAGARQIAGPRHIDLNQKNRLLEGEGRIEMAVNAYLVHRRRVGAQHQQSGHIDVLSFSWGVSQTAVYGTGASGKEAKAGRADFSNLTIMKVLDKTTPLLCDHCASGDILKKVYILYDKPVGTSSRIISASI